MKENKQKHIAAFEDDVYDENNAREIYEDTFDVKNSGNAMFAHLINKRDSSVGVHSSVAAKTRNLRAPE